MNKTSRVLAIALASAAAISVPAQTLLTDFSSIAGLGSSTTGLGPSAAFSVSGDVANYTVTPASPASTPDAAFIAYTGAVGSYTSDWSVRVDVNYAAPGSIFTLNTAQFVNLGLMIVPTGVTP
jgi:hypothetical protein